MLRINVLGPFRAERDGVPLAGATVQPRRQAILALAARAGARGIGREEVMSLLWPDAEEEKARRALNQAVYALRRDLGDDLALAGSRDLRLDPSRVSVDLWDFEFALESKDLRAAVALHAGPFLDGFRLDDTPGFERWVEAQRLELERRCEEAQRTVHAESHAAVEEPRQPMRRASAAIRIAASRAWLRQGALFASAVVLVAALGIYGISRARAVAPGASGGVIVAIGRVENRSGSDAGDATTIADLLASALVQRAGAQVVSPGRLNELARESPVELDPVRDAARRAGAAIVIEATLVRRVDGVLRLDLRRLDVATGRIVAVQSVSGDEVLALIDSGAARIMR